MDLSYSDEQQLLKDSAERFIAERCNMDARRKANLSDTEEGFSKENWAQFAELGWLGFPFSEEDGGFGGGPVETMILMEAIGKGPAVEPFFSTVVLGGGVLKLAASPEQRQAILEGVISGETLLAVAYAEPQSRFNLADVVTSAKQDGDGYVLNGHKSVVLHGGTADKIIVSARTSGEQRDADGITLFLVDGEAAGVTRRTFPTVDGHRAADIWLENVQVGADAVIGSVGGAYPVLENLMDEACAALAAEACGAMDVLLRDTVDYTKQREQFGIPIGKFQSLRHRMADMFMECEQMRSLALVATLKLMDDDQVERKKAASAAKAQIGKGGKFVGQQAVQLHGGMGVTDELNLGHYFKRVTQLDTLFGNRDYHLKRFANL